MIAAAIFYLIGAFLVGSIPFGYLIGRFAYRTDLRQHGSGNIGAMNALRTLGAKGAVAVLLLDAAKGALPVLLAHDAATGALAAACAVLGHCFSPWLHWKGGKGVATAFGAVFALSWPAGLVMVVAWVLGALGLTRYSSVGSMAAAIASPFALYGFTRSVPMTLVGIFLAIFIPWTHRENIARLRQGTEGPIRLFDRKTS
jgi:acyl phosphate:glycerol-3-phosphate acyltransferase